MGPNCHIRLAVVLLIVFFVAAGNVLPIQAIKVTVGGFLPNHLSPWSPTMKLIWAEPPPVFPDFLLIFRWVSPVPHSVYMMESKAKFDNCDFSGAKLLFPNSPSRTSCEAEPLLPSRIASSCLLRATFKTTLGRGGTRWGDSLAAMKPTTARRLAAGYLIVAFLASLVLQGQATRRNLQEIPGVRTYKVTVGGVLPYHIRPWHRGVQWDWTPPKLYPHYVLLFRWVSPLTHDVRLFESEAKYKACDFSGSKLIFPYSPVGWMLYWIKPDMVGTSLYFGSSFIGDCKAGLKVKFTVHPYGKTKKNLNGSSGTGNMTSNSTTTAVGGGG
ncbi:unnamed protein product [Closterium sp. NIES-53]